ncbi:cellulose synthase subunit C [Novosphingobium sp. Rr 2-17]|uniref:cellulose synthase subunit BcsC-related outer membrane protein n=1 Tax=Novosphingobium sp. Rr 2-17 TaxID=555793 RepID=UPI0002699566|nr:cellulose synthase subunit BcsC-related outer membrane protein [Novosphingobium sp. Rr 2-17]EIZ78057.1 cellulose synthase subunit C [Novosphingobium sp. Rr 2-17]
MTSAKNLTRPFRRASKPGMALMLSASVVAVAPMAVPQPVWAQSAGVEALVQQAKYWRSKGREDLAQQAIRRARAIDPNHPSLKSLSAPAPAPKPAAAPRSKPAPVPERVRAEPARPVAAVERPAPAKPSAPPPVSSANRAGQARMAGFDALDDGNLASAEAQFQRALTVNRRDPDALGGLGLVRLRQGNFAQASDYLEQASRLGKASQWAEGLASARFFADLGAARTALAQGRVSDAQSQAEALIRSGYKDTSPALELLADIYEKQGRFADAADLYSQAGQAGKVGATDEKRLALRATRGRALAAAERGDDMGAMREFQNGIVIDPQDPWIRYEFAEFMIKRGRVPEAESLMQSLANNGSAESLYAAALLNNDLKRPAEAERLISMIPETQRTAPMRNLAIGVKTDNAITRARALAKTGQQQQAIAALRQLGSMAAVPPGKQAGVATALFDLGDQAGAAQVAQNALDGQITNIEDYEGLIGVLARAGRTDLAQQALARAAQLAGNSPDGQRAYARINAGMMVSQADNARLAGRYAESFDILQSAYGAAPDNPEILMGIARLYQSGGMPGKAAQSFQMVLQRRPGDKDALLGLADTAQAAGDREMSQQAQRQLLRQYPQDYQVRMMLASVERARGNERAAIGLLKDARALYTRSQTTAVAGANPFAGFAAPGAAMGQGGGNPFRNQASAAPAPQLNPFALGSGSRLPTPAAYAQPAYAQPAYAQPAYGQAAYPQPASGPALPPTSATPTYGQTNYAQGTYAAPQAASAASYSQAQGGWSAAGVQGANTYDAPVVDAGAAPQQTVYSGDPVMNQIQTEIASLAQDSGPRVDVRTDYRSRSGETGLSKLNEIKGSAKMSTSLLGGRVYAKAEATVADSGRPTGSGLARFGRNATIEAQAIVDKETSALVNADTQQASGVAFAAGYEDDTVQLEAGTTPVGMGSTKFTGRAAVSPKLGENTRVTAFVERKPVTDSVISYAGTRDPVTGERWGQVMRTAGGLGLSYDRDGTGVYAEGRYYRLRGENVRNNTGYEANMGGYLRAYKGTHSSVTAGLNVNYQSYDNSQNYFTYGHGGYFSPQSFISVGFPVNYNYENQQLEAHANFTPGFQSYKEEQTSLYPTDLVAQAELDNLKALNSDVRSYYDSLSKTGFALSAGGSAYYKIGDNTRIGGEANYSTFGSYKEFRSMLGVRQSLGSTK